jgi:magnesium-transporting ATPase (P-type)
VVSFALTFFDGGSVHEGWRAYVEPLVILAILVLNAAVGVWQEARSEAALEALKELQGEHARVLREGKLVGGSCKPLPVPEWLRMMSECRELNACKPFLRCIGTPFPFASGDRAPV